MLTITRFAGKTVLTIAAMMLASAPVPPLSPASIAMAAPVAAHA